jgi:hypothetical protein
VVRREITGDIAKKTTGLTAVEEADLKVDTAGKTQRAKLMADLDLKPSVQAAVEEAVLGVRAEADKKKEEKGAERAFAVYDSAMNNLFNSLGETTTGPIIGWLPAFTANQQTADGAVAAMAPVLKDIFRGGWRGDSLQTTRIKSCCLRCCQIGRHTQKLERVKPLRLMLS